MEKKAFELAPEGVAPRQELACLFSKLKESRMRSRVSEMGPERGWERGRRRACSGG